MNWNKLIVMALHLAAGALVHRGVIHASTLHYVGGGVMALIAYVIHNPPPAEAKFDLNALAALASARRSEATINPSASLPAQTKE